MNCPDCNLPLRPVNAFGDYDDVFGVLTCPSCGLQMPTEPDLNAGVQHEIKNDQEIDTTGWTWFRISGANKRQRERIKAMMRRAWQQMLTETKE